MCKKLLCRGSSRPRAASELFNFNATCGCRFNDKMSEEAFFIVFLNVYGTPKKCVFEAVNFFRQIDSIK